MFQWLSKTGFRNSYALLDFSLSVAVSLFLLGLWLKRDKILYRCAVDGALLFCIRPIDRYCLLLCLLLLRLGCIYNVALTCGMAVLSYILKIKDLVLLLLLIWIVRHWLYIWLPRITARIFESNFWDLLSCLILVNLWTNIKLILRHVGRRSVI